ncbi:MAG: hypothetical protein GTO30_01205 [Acidobacteria bacterium]|nr:hypothetical protein [Acidobacteriota bacterium]NIM60300.1 hypothetical protein [Acidobacteriota bacterium]NIQ85576.1 hypothetical protein [Acidobacteriota bacterium]NIT11289.1 hypothetical protein [Acidobacteriota bacterium]
MAEHPKQAEIVGFDALARDRREAVLAHVADCASCRAAWLAEDGSRLFSLLSHAPIPEPKLRELSARVGAAVDRLTPQATRRLRFRIASIAASLLLAAVLGGVLWNHEWPTGRVATMDEIEALPLLDEEVAGMQVIETSGENAQVLNLNVGGTEIVMIFDESIDL